MLEHGKKAGALPAASAVQVAQRASIDPKVQDLASNDEVSDGTVDSYGRPAMKSKSGNWGACALIFGCEVCERMAFYAISANLSMYLRFVLKEDMSVAARNVNNWVGTTFLTPLIGAFVADSFAGRYWTIASFAIGYFVALVLVVMSVTLPSLKPPICDVLLDGKCKDSTRWQIGFFYAALYLMALGAGGIKSCVAGFAGDQFDGGDVKENNRKKSFMNWWFVSISFGTLMSVSFLVWIQINIGWTYGWGIPAAISAVTTIAFLIGSPIYRHQKPTGSPFVRILQVIVAAARKCRVRMPRDDSMLYEIDDKEALDLTNRRLAHTNDFRFLDKAAVSGADAAIYKFKGMQPDPWKLCTVTQVEEVKLLIRLLPIWVTNLMFSAVFAQVGTMFLNQGSTLDRRIGPYFHIPAASFPLFVTLTICTLLPLYDKFFVPFMRGITGNERGLTMLQRIGIGQLVSTCAITVAALMEMKRMAVAKKYHETHDSFDPNTEPLPMSIFCLLPQYMLTGASEVFISVGQMEFFYDQSPDSMRSVGAALYLSTVAVGSFVSSLLVTIVTKVTWNSNGGWIGNDSTKSHIDYFYWLLASLSVSNFMAYTLSARWYKYKNAPGSGSGSSSGAARLNKVKSMRAVDLNAHEKINSGCSALRHHEESDGENLLQT